MKHMEEVYDKTFKDIRLNFEKKYDINEKKMDRISSGIGFADYLQCCFCLVSEYDQSSYTNFSIAPKESSSTK